MKKEFKETIPFKMAFGYIEINMTKRVTLYIKIFKTLNKEIEKDTGGQKDLQCLWFGRINIVKMAIIIR